MAAKLSMLYHPHSIMTTTPGVWNANSYEQMDEVAPSVDAAPHLAVVATTSPQATPSFAHSQAQPPMPVNTDFRLHQTDAAAVVVEPLESAHDVDNNSIVSMEQDELEQLLHPYPFDQQSQQELDDFRELSFEDWSSSLHFSDEESMSVDGDNDTDDEASFYDDEENGEDGTNIMMKARMRNQLWKQSLKRSMFQTTQ